MGALLGWHDVALPAGRLRLSQEDVADVCAKRRAHSEREDSSAVVVFRIGARHLDEELPSAASRMPGVALGPTHRRRRDRVLESRLGACVGDVAALGWERIGYGRRAGDHLERRLRGLVERCSARIEKGDEVPAARAGPGDGYDERDCEPESVSVMESHDAIDCIACSNSDATYLLDLLEAAGWGLEHSVPRWNKLSHDQPCGAASRSAALRQRHGGGEVAETGPRCGNERLPG